MSSKTIGVTISHLKQELRTGRGRSHQRGFAGRPLRPDEIKARRQRLKELLQKHPHKYNVVTVADDAAERRALGIGPTPHITPANTEPASTEPSIAPGTHDLYMMENSRIPGEIKIGLSNNVERRKKELEAQQNFKMNVLAIFPGKGYLEKRVHDRLREFQVTEGAGNEWFKCSLGEALARLDQVLRCAASHAVAMSI